MSRKSFAIAITLFAVATAAQGGVIVNRADSPSITSTSFSSDSDQKNDPVSPLEFRQGCGDEMGTTAAAVSSTMSPVDYIESAHFKIHVICQGILTVDNSHLPRPPDLEGLLKPT